MTLHIVDVSKYQVERRDPLTLAAAQRAGFGAVNIALDRGRAQDVLSGWAPTYAAEARRLGMAVSTYRWLDNRLSGAVSARRAYDRMVALGGPRDMAHAVDVEDNATERIVHDYVTEMTRLLGRRIALYTGDWWWTAKSRGWSMADIAPYLWAPPNAGYLSGYPGDDSPHWTAGYGGWPVLTVMQYAVAPVPGTGNCSLSAVRDMAAWTALTGGNMRAANLQRLTDQEKALHPGVVIYGVGDEAHRLSPSDHNEDDTPGSKPEQQDADNNPEHRAIDVMIGQRFSTTDAWALVVALVTIGANQARLKYVIFDGWIWRRNGGWVREVYTGSDKHRDHVHVSGLAADDENASDWVLTVDAPPAQTVTTEGDDEMLFFASNPDGKGPRWGVMTGGIWVEYDGQDEGTNTALQAGKSYAQVSAATYKGLRQPFARDGRVLDGTGPVE